MGKLALLDLLDPSAEDTDRHIMFRFAGSGTGVAANALPIINNKSVFHECLCSWFALPMYSVRKCGKVMR